MPSQTRGGVGASRGNEDVALGLEGLNVLLPEADGFTGGHDGLARLVGLVEAEGEGGEAGLDVLLEVADLAWAVQHGHEDGTRELAHPGGLPGAPVDNTGEEGSGACCKCAKYGSPSNGARASSEARNVDVSDVGDTGLPAVVASAAALGGGRGDRLGGGGLGRRRGGLGGAGSGSGCAGGGLGGVGGGGCLSL